MKTIRIDLIFSYWIFYWFLLYMLGIVLTSPTLLLYLGCLINFYELFGLIYNKASTYNIIKFSVIIFLFKFIPLYFVWNRKITIYEINVSLLTIAFYLLWLHLNGTSSTKVYSVLMNSYKTGYGKKTVISTYYDTFFYK